MGNDAGYTVGQATRWGTVIEIAHHDGAVYLTVRTPDGKLKDIQVNK